MFGKRYFWESAVWVVAFVAAMELAQWLARLWPEGSAWRLLGLVPVVAAMGLGTWVELRQIARMDELHRLMYLVATMTGAMLGILFCAVATVGEILKLWPRVMPIWAVAALGLGFAIGWFAAKRRYA